MMLFPGIADVVYRKFIFQIIRVVHDFTLGLLPFTAAFLLLPVYLFFLFRFLLKRKITIGKLLLRLLNATFFTLALFLVLWGYNYACPGVFGPDKMATAPLSDEQLLQFGLATAQRTSSLREQIAHDAESGFELNESEIRTALETKLHEQDFPTLGKVRCRILKDGGQMRKLGIAGFFFPFHEEGYTSNSYLLCTQAFICAHEMSHGYGVTHEGEADFMAYVSLSNSANAELQYAAELELLRNIRGRLRVVNPPLRDSLKARTDSLVEIDLRSIYTNGLAYHEYVPGVQDKLNNFYLKAMGIGEGTKSYDEMLEMVWWMKNQH